MFHFALISPDKIVFEGEVESLIVPGGDGYFEMLTNHAPIISTLETGKVSAVDASKKKMEWNISGGLIEFHNNKASVLVDTIT